MILEQQKEKMQKYIEELIYELENFELDNCPISENKLEFDFMSFEVRTVLKTIYQAGIVRQCYTNHVNDQIDKVEEKIYKKYGF